MRRVLQTALDGAQDVGEPLVLGAARTATASAWALEETSPRSSEVATTSTRVPRSSVSSSAMPDTRRSSLPPPGVRSTSRSMSLSGVASPRATEPNRRAFVAPYRPRISSSARRWLAIAARNDSLCLVAVLMEPAYGPNRCGVGSAGGTTELLAKVGIPRSAPLRRLRSLSASAVVSRFERRRGRDCGSWFCGQA